MLSWKLWQALGNPPVTSPLYQRALRRPTELRRVQCGVILFIAEMILCLFGCLSISSGISAVVVLFSLTLPSILGVVSTLLLVYGASVTGTISSEIGTLQEQNTYEIFALTPPGQMGVSWAVALGSLHRRSIFSFFRMLLTIVAFSLCIGIVLGGILLLALALPGLGKNADTFYPTLIDGINTFTLVLALYLASIQTVVGGVLIGMLLPRYVPESSTQRLIAPGLYLCIEIVVYLLAAIGGILIFPAIIDTLHVEGRLVALSLPVLRFVLICGMLEIVNLTLWRTLIKHLNGQTEQHIII